MKESVQGHLLIRIFFDNDVDRYLPIAIAQASIFWLYVCYVYYFLQCKKCNFFSVKFLLLSFEIDVQLISFACLGLTICTYFSWTNYYLAQKRDPGVIMSNQDQQYRVRIEDKREKYSFFRFVDNYTIS